MSIEDGYRRLLRLYPRPHRLLYDEEMIAVLMAGAEPGRRRPSPAECLDIAVSATAVRLRHAGQPFRAEHDEDQDQQGGDHPVTHVIPPGA